MPIISRRCLPAETRHAIFFIGSRYGFNIARRSASAHLNICKTDGEIHRSGIACFHVEISPVSSLSLSLKRSIISARERARARKNVIVVIDNIATKMISRARYPVALVSRRFSKQSRRFIPRSSKNLTRCCVRSRELTYFPRDVRRMPLASGGIDKRSASSGKIASLRIDVTVESTARNESSRADLPACLPACLSALFTSSCPPNCLRAIIPHDPRQLTDALFHAKWRIIITVRIYYVPATLGFCPIKNVI